MYSAPKCMLLPGYAIGLYAEMRCIERQLAKTGLGKTVYVPLARRHSLALLDPGPRHEAGAAELHLVRERQGAAAGRRGVQAPLDCLGTLQSASAGVGVFSMDSFNQRLTVPSSVQNVFLLQ